MKGIIRAIDELGRIVIPKEMRKTLDVHPKDEMEMIINEDTLVLRKVNKNCVFCGSNENLVDFAGKCVCKECAEKIRSIKK